MILVNFLFCCLLSHFAVASAVTNRNWWTHSTIYEIFIWSFKDSNGDGIGDLKGITYTLDHFVELGIDALWITPFFNSPLLNAGYDISDFCDIHPTFGTIADFDELMTEAKKRDLVINHSSDEHPWFVKSVNKIEPFTDYYVWANPKGYDKAGEPIPPNNWVSFYGGSAWEWNEKREQFFLHQFVKEQPDLNLRNNVLKMEIKNVFKFWFDKGVAGVRLDATKHYIEDLHLRDEPLKNSNAVKTSLYWNDFDHIYTTDLWENYEFLHEMREYIDENFHPRNNEKIFIAEAYTNTNKTMLYYGAEDYRVVHFPFNFAFVGLNRFLNSKEYDDKIKYWLTKMPANGVANWVAENHDHRRIGNHLNVEYAGIILVTILMLPGVACIYYGQEIGMLDYEKVVYDRNFDSKKNGITGLSQDSNRSPMQWDNTLHAGFSSNTKTWHPVNPDYWRVNVEAQKRNPNSHFNLYKTLSKLRQTKTLEYGKFTSYIISPWVYAFSRSKTGEPTFITLLNLGSETEFVRLHYSIPNLPTYVKVLAATVNAISKHGDEIFTKIVTVFVKDRVDDKPGELAIRGRSV